MVSYNKSRIDYFQARTISLFPLGPGIFSTLKPAAVMALLTILLLQ